jgi:AcrR family transcriptional regulator
VHLVPAPGAPPPEESLRVRKKLTSRAKIIEAALDLFAAQGFDDTTVAQIAERAEVSPATVARYFPAKDTLLFTERDERVPLFHAEIVGRPAHESPLAAIAGALVAQPWISGETGDRLLRSRRAITRSPVLRGRAAAVLDDWRSAATDALEQRGVPALDAEVIATVTLSLLDRTTERWADAGGTDDMGKQAVEAFAALERVMATRS